MAAEFVGLRRAVWELVVRHCPASLCKLVVSLLAEVEGPGSVVPELAEQALSVAPLVGKVWHWC